MKNLTFIILNPESNPFALRSTARTIADHFPEHSKVCVLGREAKEIEDNRRHAEVLLGGDTITSLIDTGMKSMRTEWGMVILAGTHLKTYSLRKFRYFQKTDKDILYPVVNRKYAFDDASINGLLMHKNAIKEIGNFGNDQSIQLVKMIWATKAIELGYKFKAIVGARLV